MFNILALTATEAGENLPLLLCLLIRVSILAYEISGDLEVEPGQARIMWTERDLSRVECHRLHPLKQPCFPSPEHQL